MPRVTVIIPTYNYSQVLPYSIGSVLRQTFGDFELLVIGDCCTDDSGAVVGAVADPRVRWINLPQATGHQSGPNNYGLRHGVGEFAAYLGHDDLWLPNHLELAVKALDAGADLTYGLTEMVHVGGRSPAFAPLELEPYIPGMWIPPTSVVHRREAALALGGWRHYVDDAIDPEAMLWRRLHESGKKIRFVGRLTAVKFPAAWRKNVYGEKPVHEQAMYAARMQAEGDFAEREVVRMLLPMNQEGWQQRAFGEVLREFLGDVGARVRWRLARMGVEGAGETRGEKFARMKRFKGVGEAQKRD